MSWLNPAATERDFAKELSQDRERVEFFRLAQVLALAVRVEPLLLRNARLHFLPASATELETALWFDDRLIYTRSTNAAVMRSGIARSLCDDLLKRDPQCFHEAKRIIADELTRHWPQTDRIEQNMRWAILENDTEALRNNFRRILKTLALTQNASMHRELARWAKGALPGLATRDRAGTEALWLYQFVSAALGSPGTWLTVGTAEPLPPSLMMALPRVAPTWIAVQLRRGVLEALAPDGRLPAIEISLPLPTSVLLRFDSSDQFRWEGFWIGRRIRVPKAFRQIILETLNGDRYRIAVEGTKPSVTSGTTSPEPITRVMLACMPDGQEQAQWLARWLSERGIATEVADDREPIRVAGPEIRLLRLWTRASANYWRDRPEAMDDFTSSVLVIAWDSELPPASTAGSYRDIIYMPKEQQELDESTADRILRALALGESTSSVSSRMMKDNVLKERENAALRNLDISTRGDNPIIQARKMANPDHLAMLKQGVEAWNKWRQMNPDLEQPYLGGVDLRGADLRGADLRGANLGGADLRGANLGGADFHRADLDSAELGEAVLREANLGGADLRRADLRGAVLRETDLGGVNFSEVLLEKTILANINLTKVEGLATCRHKGISHLDFHTLQQSGPLPLVFLRGCGLPDWLIDYLPSLLNQPVQYYSCFISYSSKDEEFARRLYADLQNKGVRCWFAPQDLRQGRKLHEQVREAIQVYEKLLLVLSEHSMNSEWVRTEIASAQQREVRERRQILFPIGLVDFKTIQQWHCFDVDTGKDLAREIREYFIPDFSNWKSYDAYQQTFDRLLRNLKPALESKPEE